MTTGKEGSKEKVQKIKVLNLYAGIGGNRKLWPNDKIEVTAVEINPKIAKIYQDFFPEDKVIIGDAHQYLLEHFKEFDFIWSSPPCPTHSRTNTFLNAQGVIRYPDMSLWQEIVFLQAWCNRLWCVENVISYYEPLDLRIAPQLSDRHYLWANFNIAYKRRDLRVFNICNARESTRKAPKDNYKALQEYHGFDLSKYKNIYHNGNHDQMQILRNCVNPKLGLHIFNCAFKTKQIQLTEVSP